MQRDLSAILRRIRSDCGVSFVEAAIFLPVALMIIFMFLWIAVFMISSSNFDASLTKAVRLASRGTRDLVGQDLLQVVNNWNRNGGEMSATEAPYFTNQVPPAEADKYLNLVSSYTFAVTFASLPAEYMYTMVYIKEALVESIGGTVKFPCRADPTDPLQQLGEGSVEGPGCVSCRFLNPDTLQTDPVTGTFPNRRIAIECEFQPSNFILTPIFNLIRMISGNAVAPKILITRIRVMDWQPLY